MKYPGRVIRLGEADPKVVKAVKAQLNMALHLAQEVGGVLDVANPMLKTAHCLTLWNGAKQQGAVRVHTSDAVANPALVKPGMLFIIDHGEGRGHTCVVERVAGEFIHTIEGNTDGSGTREGGGVYRLRRKVDTINKGFIDYA